MDVVRYTQVNGDGPTVAFVSLKIPQWGVTFNDCRVIRGKEGQFFIGFPSRKYEVEGETKYSPYVWFDKEVSERFQKGAREAIDTYVKQNQEKAHVSEPSGNVGDAVPF